MMICKGQLVEFTDERKFHYTIGQEDALYGVAIEDRRKDGTVMVEMADGTERTAVWIHAFAWGGWIPDGLEAVWEKHNPEKLCDH